MSQPKPQRGIYLEPYQFKAPSVIPAHISSLSRLEVVGYKITRMEPYPEQKVIKDFKKDNLSAV